MRLSESIWGQTLADFKIKALYQRQLASVGDSYTLTALDHAYNYRLSTPDIQAYWLPRRKQHSKTRATLPPKVQMWIEYSEPLHRTQYQKMRGTALPEVAALWFWHIGAFYQTDIRWRLDLIDDQGNSTEYFYFYPPTTSVFKGQWSFPHRHLEQCGLCTHLGRFGAARHQPQPSLQSDFFLDGDHDAVMPCIIPHTGCEQDLRAWRNRLCEVLELIQKNQYRPEGNFFL